MLVLAAGAVTLSKLVEGITQRQIRCQPATAVSALCPYRHLFQEAGALGRPSLVWAIFLLFAQAAGAIVLAAPPEALAMAFLLRRCLWRSRYRRAVFTKNSYVLSGVPLRDRS